MKDDHRRGRTGVAVFGQHRRHFGFAGLAAEDTLADERVHVDVRLVQPQPLDVGRPQLELVGVLDDHLRHHRRDILEHAAPVLDEQPVAVRAGFGFGTIEKAEVVANIVRELGLELGAEHIEALPRLDIVAVLDECCGADIAEDEMAVAITKVQVRRADFRIDHEHGPGAAGLDHVGRGLNTEGGRGTGHVQIEAELPGTQILLNFHRERRIGARQVRTGHQDRVNILRSLARLFQAGLDRRHGHLALQRRLVVATGTNPGVHHLGIENAALFHHVAALDTRRLIDEVGVRRRQRLQFAAFDGGGVVAVVILYVGIEGGDQFFVGNRLRRCIEPGGRDNDVVHLYSPSMTDKDSSARHSRARAAVSQPCLIRPGGCRG